MNIRQQTPHEPPRRIQVAPGDNVAIIVNSLGLPAGSVFADGLTLNHFVPQGHKVALADIADGGDIIRYNEVIGTAKGDIRRGDWINEDNVVMGTAPPLDQLEMATRPPPAPEPLTGHTFEGYRNADGTVGTKNILAVSTSVQCVSGTMEFALKRIKAELLPKYPNVDDVVVLTHAYGCGVAINAPQAVVPIRTLQNLARNPNFGGEVLVVGLGCEKLVPERLLPAGQENNNTLRMQDEAFVGFGAMIDGIMAMVEDRLNILNKRQRETVPAAELIVGMQCGGSDAFSGLTANPALGYCADLLVRAGATVMFSEVTEVRDAIHLLTPRAATKEVADALVREMKWYDSYLDQGGVDRGANTTPGNKEGWPLQHHRKIAGLGRQVRHQRHQRRAGAGRKGAPARAGVRRNPGIRLRLRHAADGLRHEPACLHHRPRYALWPGRRAGDQGRHPQRAGEALERFDRPGCRAHRHGRKDHRTGGLGAVPADAGCRQRPQAGLGRQMGPAQRPDAV